MSKLLMNKIFLLYNLKNIVWILQYQIYLIIFSCISMENFKLSMGHILRFYNLNYKIQNISRFENVLIVKSIIHIFMDSKIYLRLYNSMIYFQILKCF